MIAKIIVDISTQDDINRKLQLLQYFSIELFYPSTLYFYIFKINFDVYKIYLEV